MAAMDEYGEEKADKGLDRILALSDGVFAFSLTLLALDLVVPAVAAGPREPAELLAQLQSEWVSFWSYFLSFFIVGVYWFGHHRNFRYIKRYDSGLMWVNMCFLLFITLVPFFTKLLDAYEAVPLTAQLYALDQAAAGLSATATWTYATRGRRLVDRTLGGRFVRKVALRNAASPIIFTASIAAAGYGTYVTSIVWLSSFPVALLISRIYKD